MNEYLTARSSPRVSTLDYLADQEYGQSTDQQHATGHGYQIELYVMCAH